MKTEQVQQQVEKKNPQNKDTEHVYMHNNILTSTWFRSYSERKIPM